MARTGKAPTVAVKPPKNPNTISRMSSSHKQSTVKTVKHKNNDSVVKQDPTDCATKEELKKALRKTKNFKRNQRRKKVKANAARQDDIVNIIPINQSVETSVPSVSENKKKVVYFSDANEDDFDHNLSKFGKKKKPSKIKKVNHPKVTVKVNNKLFKHIDSPVTSVSKLVVKKKTQFE